jgi:hypothetical protein
MSLSGPMATVFRMLEPAFSQPTCTPYPAEKIPVQTTAWYAKSHATFADVLAAVGQHLWGTVSLPTSVYDPDLVEIPGPDLLRLAQAVCYAH